MARIKVNLTTEEGIILDQFVVERTDLAMDPPVTPETQQNWLASAVRDHVEMKFEVEDPS